MYANILLLWVLMTSSHTLKDDGYELINVRAGFGGGSTANSDYGSEYNNDDGDGGSPGKAHRNVSTERPDGHVPSLVLRAPC